MEHLYPASVWIPQTIIFLIATIIHIFIILNEMWNRNRRTKPFASNSLRLWSLITIFSGYLFALCNAIQFVPGICKISAYLGHMTSILQPLALGLYQLSRLYHCFANEQQINSNEGYPKWIFIFMYICAILFWINMNFMPLSFAFFVDGTLKSKCGINDKYEFYAVNFQFSCNVSTEISIAWVLVIWASYGIWDITTLLLFAFKIAQLRRKLSAENVTHPKFKRIMGILYKVLVMTLFYQICWILVIVFEAILAIIGNQRVLYSLAYCICSVVWSFAIRLMMEHNHKGYIEFLRVIHCLKLHWICCKWRDIVTLQLKENKMDYAVVNTTSTTLDDNENASPVTLDNQGTEEITTFQYSAQGIME